MERNHELLQVDKRDLWRVFRTLHEMLRANGFEPRTPLKDLSEEEFARQVRVLQCDYLAESLAAMTAQGPSSKSAASKSLRARAAASASAARRRKRAAAERRKQAQDRKARREARKKQKATIAAALAADKQKRQTRGRGRPRKRADDEEDNEDDEKGKDSDVSDDDSSVSSSSSSSLSSDSSWSGPAARRKRKPKGGKASKRTASSSSDDSSDDTSDTSDDSDDDEASDATSTRASQASQAEQKSAASSAASSRLKSSSATASSMPSGTTTGGTTATGKKANRKKPVDPSKLAALEKRLIFTATRLLPMEDEAPEGKESKGSQGGQGGASGPLLVVFVREHEAGVRCVLELRWLLEQRYPEVRNVVLVSHAGLTQRAEQDLQAQVVAALRVRVRSFTFADLLANISQHQLVRPHRALTAAERAQVEARYRLVTAGRPPALLPVLRAADPLALYHDLVPGDMVVIRDRGLAATFRAVEGA